MIELKVAFFSSSKSFILMSFYISSEITLVRLLRSSKGRLAVRESDLLASSIDEALLDFIFIYN